MLKLPLLIVLTFSLLGCGAATLPKHESSGDNTIEKFDRQLRQYIQEPEGKLESYKKSSVENAIKLSTFFYHKKIKLMI